MKNIVTLKGRKSTLRTRDAKVPFKMGPVMLGYIALGLLCFVSIIYFWSLIGLQAADMDVANLEKEIKVLSDQQETLERQLAEQKRLSIDETQQEVTENEEPVSRQTVADTLQMVKVTNVSYLTTDRTVAMAR